ncbi:MAG TPA: NTP transferase domain-containing protein [Rickettsiales bacterium]|nr:NTP transferase domain-containing protein [Rickettsiales bacterium]
MQYPKHAIISCAGLGSRLGLNIPKCLVDIGGKKMLERQLNLLKNIKDIRIVVGFKEMEVINFAKSIRKDITFVRNPNYATTSNSYSIYLATNNLKEPHIIIDGDLIIEKSTFNNFLKQCGNKNLVGVTKTKTEDAVFVKTDNNLIIESFSRTEKDKYEWCGIAYLYDIKIPKDQGYVFKELEKKLPLQAINIQCFEVDTPIDLNNAIKSINNNDY